MPITRHSSCRFCVAVLLALSSCKLSDLTDLKTTIAGVSIGIGYSGYTSDAFLTLGATDSLQAQAYSGGWPSHTIYQSSIEPTRFHYLSTNPAVARVDSLGRVTTLSVGETEFTATVAGVTSPTIRLAVSPSASALTAEPATVSTRVGDTFAISIKAVDSSGQSVPDVIFNMGLDTTYWAVTSEPLEGSWKLHTPIVLHLQAKIAGRVRLRATVQNQRAESRYQVWVPVTVEPR